VDTVPTWMHVRPELRRWVTEAILVAAVAIATGLRIWVSAEPGARSPTLMSYTFGVLIAALLPARRRAPLGVLLATVGLLIIYHALGNPGISPVIPLAVPLYAAAVAGRLGWAVGAAGVAMAATTLATVMKDELTVPAAIVQLTPQIGLVASLILLGEAIRSRRALARDARRAAEHAVADQELETKRRVAEERLRIARELHDVLAHTLAGAAIQASVAADTLTDDPAVSRAAIEAVRTCCREARVELAATVGVLRADPQSGTTAAPDRTPVPGLNQLDAILEMGRRAGLRVEVITSGEVRELPTAIDLIAYRIVQESMTNVVQHAKASSVMVSLTYRPADVTISVIDDGRGDGRGLTNHNGTNHNGVQHNAVQHNGLQHHARVPGGYGVIGMRERATAVGGRLLAGNRPDQGFQVTAILPAPVEAGAAG
jgi:signal transduction histidine kinase